MSFDAEFARSFTEDKIAFVQRMGLKAEVLERGHIRLRAPLKGNSNHIGTMYAGALFTLAEIPGGSLFLTSFDIRQFYPIIKDMKLEFLKPATTDIYCELTMKNEEIERLQTIANDTGKAEFILSTELTDINGTVVARSKGTYQIRKTGS